MSHTSPKLHNAMWPGLVGKEEGDVVVVKAPGGDIEYEIDQVHHV